MVENESVYDALTAEVSKPSYEELSGQLNAALDEQARILGLNQYYNQLLISRGNEQRTKEAQLETYLDENWDDLGDHAEAIAEIFGLSMDKTVTVKMTVEVEVKVTVPRNAVEDIAQYEFDFTADYSGEGDLEDSGFDIVSFEVEED